MIEQTLTLLGKLKAAPDVILMRDGDALEINIIRDGQRMTILNLSHSQVDDSGNHLPVAPLPIQITIEKGSADGGTERREFDRHF